MLIRILKLWLPFAFLSTVLAGTIYVAVQQNYRLNANDPQKQIAEDIQNEVWNNGVDPKTLVPFQKIDLSVSLSPFVQIYDSNFNLVAGNVFYMDKNNIPKIPQGVLNAASMPNDIGENSITWQPGPQTRIAVDARQLGDKGYVLVGRSLREVEARIGNLTLIVGLGWGVATFGSLVLIGALEFLSSPKRR